jgi:hypothetical protein
MRFSRHRNVRYERAYESYANTVAAGYDVKLCAKHKHAGLNKRAH